MLCLIGIHNWECLTPEHGFVVSNGLDGVLRPQFLHVSRCTRCGKVKALVSLLYFTIHRPDWLRDPTAGELDLFLTLKTRATNRMPIPEQSHA